MSGASTTNNFLERLSACETSAQVVPLYVELIGHPNSNEIAPVFNDAILRRWARTTLVSIKQAAWKQVGA